MYICVYIYLNVYIYISIHLYIHINKSLFETVWNFEFERLTILFLFPRESKILLISKILFHYEYMYISMVQKI